MTCFGTAVGEHAGLGSSRDNTVVNSQSTRAFRFGENDPAKLREKHNILTRT